MVAEKNRWFVSRILVVLVVLGTALMPDSPTTAFGEDLRPSAESSGHFIAIEVGDEDTVALLEQLGIPARELGTVYALAMHLHQFELRP